MLVLFLQKIFSKIIYPNYSIKKNLRTYIKNSVIEESFRREIFFLLKDNSRTRDTSVTIFGSAADENNFRFALRERSLARYCGFKSKWAHTTHTRTHNTHT